jgi:hypothetical protein
LTHWARFVGVKFVHTQAVYRCTNSMPRINHLEIVRFEFNTSKSMTPDSELEEIKARYAIHMAEEAQRKLKKAAQQIERITAIAANRVNLLF